MSALKFFFNSSILFLMLLITSLALVPGLCFNNTAADGLPFSLEITSYSCDPSSISATSFSFSKAPSEVLLIMMFWYCSSVLNFPMYFKTYCKDCGLFPEASPTFPGAASIFCSFKLLIIS